MDDSMPSRRWRNEGTRYIYGLVDAAGAFRYVGQTSNVRKRLRYHWTSRETNRTQPALAKWLRSLDASPGIMVLAEVASQDANATEREWIERLARTSDLLNVTGVPGWRNDKARAAALAKTTGAIRPNVSAAVREAWRTGRMTGTTGQPQSAETRRKIAEAQRGRPLTEQHKRALREGWARRRERLAAASE